jgi:hypothetical protein
MKDVNILTKNTLNYNELKDKYKQMNNNYRNK